MISVVIPVYNVEKYLTQCIESILNQSYKDYEIILVDDGSTDNSSIICDSYEKYSNITVVHKNNEGLGYARNTGIKHAKGEYVMFVDSDDYLRTDTLEKLFNDLSNNKSDTCIGGYTRVSNDGEELFEDVPNFCVYDGTDSVSKEFFPRLLGSSPEKKDAFRPSVWNALYSMEIIRSNNLLFPSERELIAEDIVFDIEYYKYSKKVVLSANSGYCYRVTPGSLTQKYKPDRFEKIVYLFEYILKRVTTLRYADICTLRAKRQFFVYLYASISQENIDLSKATLSKALKNIKKICNHSFTKFCISTYPVVKMGIAQTIFIILVKLKMTLMLYLLICNKRKRALSKA